MDWLTHPLFWKANNHVCQLPVEVRFCKQAGCHPSKAFHRLGKVWEVEATAYPVSFWEAWKDGVLCSGIAAFLLLPGHLKQKSWQYISAARSWPDLSPDGGFRGSSCPERQLWERKQLWEVGPSDGSPSCFNNCATHFYIRPLSADTLRKLLLRSPSPEEKTKSAERST